MLDQYAATGLDWPAINEQEMTDLLTYLQNLPSTKPQSLELSLPTPEAGRSVFQEKGCVSCHLSAPQISRRENADRRVTSTSTLTGLAAAMWNHTLAQKSQSDATSKPIQPLSEKEMAAVISYFWSLNRFDSGGSPDRGKRVFAKKGCTTCHTGEGLLGAPDTPRSTDISSARIASAVWVHGPTMFERMKQQGLDWPQISGTEMADLVAYLRSTSPGKQTERR
jgi:mono/diheme cytochrome c family protein